jgi:multiple sugar transport system substrate-binding protein
MPFNDGVRDNNPRGKDRSVSPIGGRHRSSRRTFVATVGAGASLSLAGCIGGDPLEDETELVFWHQEEVPHRVEAFDEFLDQFNDEHDDITVTQEPQNWDEVLGSLTSALEAGNEPDFMFSLPAFTMTFQAQDQLVDVTDLLEEIDDERSFFEPTKRPFQYDGGTWGIPMWDMIFLNHHRESVYADAPAWPPDNWDEWLESAAAVTDPGENEYGICLPANANLWTTENLYTLMINNGAYVYGPDGGIMFDTEETVETLEFYQELFDQASPSDATGWDWADWERSLLEEDTFSTIGFTSWKQPLQDTEHADDWTAIEQPYPEDGQQGSVHYVNNIMVFNEDRLDDIGTFVKWLHEPGTYGAWLAETEPTLYLPVTEDGEADDSFWDHELVSMYQESVELQFDALEHASVYGFRDIHVENDLYLPSVGELEGSHVLGQIVQDMIIDEMTAEEAATHGQELIEDTLELERSEELD